MQSGLITLAVVLIALALGASPARAGTWYLTVTPARVLKGGNVMIHTTINRRCHVKITGPTGHYSGTMKRSLSLNTRQAYAGRARLTVTCGNTYATTTFTVLKRRLAKRTPITVANVCSRNSGLGTVHYETATDGTTIAYWLNSYNNKPTLLTDSGDNVAAVVDPEGTGLVYFAACTWSRWLSVAQFEAQQESQGVAAAQASSFAYLVQEQQNNALLQEDSDWFTPSAGWQECADGSGWCDYEETYDDL